MTTKTSSRQERREALSQSLEWHLTFFVEELALADDDVAQVLREWIDWYGGAAYEPTEPLLVDAFA